MTDYDNSKKLLAVKKILLAAGGRSGLLRMLPLYSALSGLDRYDVVLAGPPSGLLAGDAESLLDVFGAGESYIVLREDGASSIGRTASCMLQYEQLLLNMPPDFIMIAGDDDQALAASLAASRMGIPYASMDAGLRTYDRTSAAEGTRRIVDAAADVFFVSEHSGAYNLINEGVDEDRMFFTGNLLIDTLAAVISRSNESQVLSGFGMEAKEYVLVLLDDPVSLNSLGSLKTIARVLESISSRKPVLLQVGSGVEELFRQHEMTPAFTGIENLRLTRFSGYRDLLRLVKDALFVLADSPVVQAESTVMKVPCITMNPSTTSPATIETGTGLLVGIEEGEILERVEDALSGKLGRNAKIPEKWDGATSQRIIDILERLVQ
jgi:UDP-N-acetylglucosamine 2-epimerase (non-hydrolysing)